MTLFLSRKDAEKAAKKAGMIGLTGSGQECGAVVTTDPQGRMGWFYHSAHSVFDLDTPGVLIFQDEMVPADSEKGKEFLA